MGCQKTGIARGGIQNRRWDRREVSLVQKRRDGEDRDEGVGNCAEAAMEYR